MITFIADESNITVGSKITLEGIVVISLSEQAICQGEGFEQDDH